MSAPCWRFYQDKHLALAHLPPILLAENQDDLVDLIIIRQSFAEDE
jgi:hypothetical protein